ncbi:MAG: alpha/beta fold hydrolase [Acidimicrobiales bacterium]
MSSPSTGGSAEASNDVSGNSAFVLVHGAWHNGATWDDLVPELAARGHLSVTLDLPGAGENAAVPASFHQRPLDPAAFATEPSPNAGVTQDSRSDAVIAAVELAAQQGNGEVVLVGHSLGGLTISPVAEAIPDRLKAVVYITAFLLPNDMAGGEIIGHEINAAAEVPPLFMADPEQVGALRMDVASPDPDYRAAVKSAFYADLTDQQFADAVAKLHCDEPAQVAGVPSNITAGRFGTVDRHYVRCADDRAILAATQDLMVTKVDEQLGSTTTVHNMNASHSPFYSDPAGLADILASIAG